MASVGDFPLSGLDFSKKTYMGATLFSLAVLYVHFDTPLHLRVVPLRF